MKNKLFRIMIILGISYTLTGCNKQLIDMTYEYKYAIINTANGCIEGEVQSWNDYDNSDQIQVKINGITYLVHSDNITLLSKKPAK